MRSHTVLLTEGREIERGSGMVEAGVKAENAFLKVFKGGDFTATLRSKPDAF